MKNVPLWLVSNKNIFSYLKVDGILEDDKEQEICPVTLVDKECIAQLERKKWERKLPHIYKIITTAGLKSLCIKMQFQTIDTAEVHGIEGLVNYDADREYKFAQKNKITTCKLV